MPMRIGTELPSFEGATEWFNATGAHAAAEAKGHTTLVHFWSVSCGLCKENLPRVAEWRDRRASEGLRVIAVHMPRYEADTVLPGCVWGVPPWEPPQGGDDERRRVADVIRRGISRLTAPA